MQQQNSRLLADVVAAQRRAAEVTKEKVQVAAELAEMQHQVTKTSGLSQEMQHRLQATSADHAQALADLRSAHLAQPPLVLVSCCLFIQRPQACVCAIQSKEQLHLTSLSM